jgi:CMP/dCMP kinase
VPDAPRGLTIAIDGPASSGKGTVARLVARQLGYAWLDSGSMFRAVALLATERGVPLDDGDALGRLADGLDFRYTWAGDRLSVSVDGRDLTEAIRTEAVGQGASRVSAFGPVRRALLERQRALAAAGAVVMDGRDIGTVVLPDADLKIFLDATAAERARRRTLDLQARILADIEARDHQDRTRALAPLRQAEDSVFLDSTGLGPDAVAARVVDLARARGAR